MIRALDIAEYFLTLQDEDAGDAISNLKLQKLLYYAQGLYLALNGRKLFDEKIKAWQHGPVVPEVWHNYKEFGNRSIEPPTGFDPDVLPEEVTQHLDEIWQAFGQFSAWRLRDMTHSEAPYENTDMNEEILPSMMKDYFESWVIRENTVQT